MLAPLSTNPEERENSSSTPERLSKLRWTGNSSKIQEPHHGGNGHWRSAYKRGSTSIRSRSSSLRDCAVTRRHSCRSWGKVCEEHSYTCEWASRQKPHLTKDGKTFLCKTENYAPLVVPGLSSNSSTSSSSTSPPQNPAHSRSNEEVAGNSTEGIPEWLEHFTEIEEMPAAAKGSAQYLYSLPERPKLRGLQTNQDEAKWWFGTSGREIWWLGLRLITKSSTKDVNLGTIIDT